jgi:riboflavin kinase/FMN adenylyltransferase
MKLLAFHQVPPDFLSAAAVTVGNFDGVHIGHRAIIRAALHHGQTRKVPTVVVTFDPHPREVLVPGQTVPAITTFAERARLIGEMGVDFLFQVEFTRAFAEKSADEFIADMAAKVHPLAVVIGHDFRFGRGREGDDQFLAARGEGLGFQVQVVPAVEFEGEPVSSTRIRAMIAAGQMRRVRRLLGAPFSVTGVVVSGHGRGRELGFATANLCWENKLIPAEGVYAALAYLEDQDYPAVVNIGKNPTFDDQDLSLEAHLLDYDGDLYQRRLRVAFLRRLRGERKFDSPAALVEQIKQDVFLARATLAEEGDSVRVPEAPDLEAAGEDRGR